MNAAGKTLFVFDYDWCLSKPPFGARAEQVHSKHVSSGKGACRDDRVLKRDCLGFKGRSNIPLALSSHDAEQTLVWSNVIFHFHFVHERFGPPVEYAIVATKVSAVTSAPTRTEKPTLFGF